jgi:CheY-like chemotaxis protein
MNKSLSALTPINPNQLLARVGLPHQVTFSERLREQFNLPEDVHDHAWLDVLWAVRCTLTGCLPALESQTPAGLVQLSEFLSLPAGSADPVNRTIAVVHKNPTTLHVVLPEEVQTHPAFVLVVEDDPHVGELVLLLVRSLGVEAVWARDGETGWERLQQPLLPFVVITDVDMPRLNGLELCRRMKASHRMANIPVLVWSGNPAHESKSRNLGAAEFLSKPVEPRLLLDWLRQFIV